MRGVDSFHIPFFALLMGREYKRRYFLARPLQGDIGICPFRKIGKHLSRGQNYFTTPSPGSKKAQTSRNVGKNESAGVVEARYGADGEGSSRSTWTGCFHHKYSSDFITVFKNRIFVRSVQWNASFLGIFFWSVGLSRIGSSRWPTKMWKNRKKIVARFELKTRTEL